MTAILPAGKYYIGDLCYVLGDMWDEVCHLIFDGETEGKLLELKSGTKFVYFHTAYGDGTYRDSTGEYEFSVDAGLIGAVLVDAEDVDADRAEELGAVVDFPLEWVAELEDRGQMCFGSIYIDTAGEEEDDYYDPDYYVEEEDDY